jgi:hypothetical protein
LKAISCDQSGQRLLKARHSREGGERFITAEWLVIQRLGYYVKASKALDPRLRGDNKTWGSSLSQQGRAEPAQRFRPHEPADFQCHRLRDWRIHLRWIRPTCPDFLRPFVRGSGSGAGSSRHKRKSDRGKVGRNPRSGFRRTNPQTFSVVDCATGGFTCGGSALRVPIFSGRLSVDRGPGQVRLVTNGNLIEAR